MPQVGRHNTSNVGKKRQTIARLGAFLSRHVNAFSGVGGLVMFVTETVPVRLSGAGRDANMFVRFLGAAGNETEKCSALNVPVLCVHCGISDIHMSSPSIYCCRWR